MDKLLTKTGLDVVERFGTFPMEAFLLSGLNYIGNSEIGYKCHNIRKVFEMNMYKDNVDILNNIYSVLIEQNIGREFFIVARKNN